MTPKSLDFYITASLWLLAITLITLAVLSLRETNGMANDTALRSSEEGKATMRIYDVHDLMDNWKSYRREPIAMNCTSNNQQQNPQHGGAVCFPASTPPSDPLMDELATMITETIDQESWAVAGGNKAFISAAGQTLVVGGNHALQRDIARFLTAMRAADANYPVVLRQ
jgi:hypothetical protein